MIIIPYVEKDHSTALKRLLASHKLPEALIYDLPKFGLVALKGNELVAYGGARIVEGNRIMLDSYVTEATFSSLTRGIAITRITNKLIKLAKQNNIKQVIAFSKHESFQERCINLGFMTFPNNILQILTLR